MLWHCKCHLETSKPSKAQASIPSVVVRPPEQGGNVGPGPHTLPISGNVFIVQFFSFDYRLLYCSDFISDVDVDLMTKISQLLDRMNLYKEILDSPVNSNQWKKWQTLDIQCQKDPTTVVKQLLSLKQFSLARKVTVIFFLCCSRTILLSYFKETNHHFNRISFDGFVQRLQKVSMWLT